MKKVSTYRQGYFLIDLEGVISYLLSIYTTTIIYSNTDLTYCYMLNRILQN